MKSTPGQDQQTKDPNDIKIGMNSRTKNIVRYCNGLLKEKTATFLKLSAIGQAITMLVDAVEILKIVNPGLYQSNKISTVSFQSTDENQNVTSQKMYPKFEVVLSLEPREKNEGYQDKIPEEERKKMFELFSERPMRTGFEGRGQRGGRGRGFGGRGFGGRGFGGRGQRGGRGRGFGGRGRDFGDRGFGDRGYGDRGYGDRDFGDRGFRGRGFRGRGFGGRGRDDYREERHDFESRDRDFRGDSRQGGFRGRNMRRGDFRGRRF